jgi:hypothetical protein
MVMMGVTFNLCISTVLEQQHAHHQELHDIFLAHDSSISKRMFGFLSIIINYLRVSITIYIARGKIKRSSS